MTKSPDCRDGNCSKCNGEAWDLERDQLTSCDCPHHQDHAAGIQPPEQAFDPGPPWELLGQTRSGFRVFTAPPDARPPSTPPRISDR